MITEINALNFTLTFSATRSMLKFTAICCPFALYFNVNLYTIIQFEVVNVYSQEMERQIYHGKFLTSVSQRYTSFEAWKYSNRYM
jgi:hypothetical protein